MSDRNPPGWGIDGALAVVLSRIPQDRYGVAVGTRYEPDATEIVTVTIDRDGDVVSTAEGTRSQVVGKLLVWLQGEGL